MNFIRFALLGSALIVASAGTAHAVAIAPQNVLPVTSSPESTSPQPQDAKEFLWGSTESSKDFDKLAPLHDGSQLDVIFEDPLNTGGQI